MEAAGTASSPRLPRESHLPRQLGPDRLKSRATLTNCRQLDTGLSSQLSIAVVNPSSTLTFPSTVKRSTLDGRRSTLDARRSTVDAQRSTCAPPPPAPSPRNKLRAALDNFAMRLRRLSGSSSRTAHRPTTIGGVKRSSRWKARDPIRRIDRAAHSRGTRRKSPSYIEGMNSAPTPVAQLSDHDLVAEVGRLAQSEREATAALLAALSELDARRLYLAEGYASLFAYCTQRLHYSEHAAYHRIEAARARAAVSLGAGAAARWRVDPDRRRPASPAPHRGEPSRSVRRGASPGQAARSRRSSRACMRGPTCPRRCAGCQHRGHPRPSERRPAYRRRVQDRSILRAAAVPGRRGDEARASPCTGASSSGSSTRAGAISGPDDGLGGNAREARRRAGPAPPRRSQWRSGCRVRSGVDAARRAPRADEMRGEEERVTIERRARRAQHGVQSQTPTGRLWTH